MRSKLRIFVLLDDMAGSVQSGCDVRSEFLAALEACEYVERVDVMDRRLPRLERGAAAAAAVSGDGVGRHSFALRLLAYAWRNGRADLVVCNDPRMLALAWTYARLCRSQLAMFVDGSLTAPRQAFGLFGRLSRSIDSFAAATAQAAERFGRSTGVAMDRGFLLPRVGAGGVSDPAAIGEFRAAVGDWLWGCVSIAGLTRQPAVGNGL